MCGVTLSVIALSSPRACAEAVTSGQSAETQSLIKFDIAPQSLATALGAFGIQAGQPVLFTPDLVADKTSKGVSGALTISSALTQLLAGTGLIFKNANGTILIMKGDRGALDLGPGDSANVAQIAEVTVTANKRSQRLQDVPASITAETGEMLEHRGATQLEDIGPCRVASHSSVAASISTPVMPPMPIFSRAA